MRPPVIIEARHKQGLAAYRAGLSLRELYSTLDEIERMHEQVQGADATVQHEEIANSGPSLIAGFADGLIDDIRNLARSTVFQRRGVSA